MPKWIFSESHSLFRGGDIKSFALLFWEIVEKNQYHVELVKEHDIVFDAGANIGIFSILAAVKNPHATIYAFEPTPETYAALKENTKHYPNIKTFNCALGESEGEANLIVDVIPESNYLEDRNLGGGILRRTHHFFRRIFSGVSVIMKTIDGMGTRVDFLKMDTEGYEANILKGAAETIKKYKPTIVMSAYHKPGDKTELPKLLNSMVPYACELHSDGEEDLICKTK